MIFYLLAFLMTILALAAVFTKQILRSVVYLMGVLTLSSGLYLLLGAEFLAGVQVLVYVGGIVVLLVFAVMLTQSKDLMEDKPSVKRKVLGALASLGFFATSLLALSQTPFSQKLAVPDMLSNSSFSIAAIGRAFLSAEKSGYLVPFELISVLLLTVLIAGIVIARKEKLQ